MIDSETLMTYLRHALARLQYGEIVIKVERGRPVWLEVHEKTRIPAPKESG